MASEMDWWAVPLVAFVSFTLQVPPNPPDETLLTEFSFRYGIEGIAQTYEDPFGVAKIDINMDDIVEDARREVETYLLAWQNQGSSGGIFRPCLNELRRSGSNISRFYRGDSSSRGVGLGQNAPPVFVVSDVSGEDPFWTNA